MAIAITGAAGFLGGNLVRQLLAQGQPVRGLFYSEADRMRLEGLGVEAVYGDVTHLDSLQRAFAGAEVVYHLASFITLLASDAPLANVINVQGVRNVVQACLGQGVRRLVHVSSFHALRQEPFDRPIDETSPLLPPNHHYLYGRTKAQGEQIAQAAAQQGLEVVIVRPTGMLGIHDYQPSHFGSVLLDLARGQLPGFVQGGCDFVDVRDVAVGMIAAQQRAPSGSLYLLGGEYLPMPTVARWVAEISGKPAPRLIVPLGLAKALAPWAVQWSSWVGGRPRFTPDSIEAILSNPMISHTKAERELGYHPRPLQESLRETLAWLLEHHPA